MGVKIADALALPEEVSIGRGKIALNGIDATAIAKLIVVYKDQVLSFFGNDSTNFAGLIIAAPELVIDLIAASAGAEDQRDDIKRIPIAAQVECLAAIYRLSVPDEKKFIQSLEWILGAIQSARTAREVSQPLPTKNSPTSLSDGSESSPEQAGLPVFSNA